MIGRFLASLRMPVLWSLLNKPLPRTFERRLYFSKKSFWWASGAVLFTFVFITIFCSMMATNATPILPLFVIGLMLGAIPAAGVSAAINTLRERGTFDLLCLTPAGQNGISWLIAGQFARSHPMIGALRQTLLFAQLCLFMLLLVGVVGGLLDAGLITDPVFYANLLVFLILMRADYLYSIVTGTLIALLSTVFFSRRIDSAILSGAAFIGVQLGLYVGFVLVNFLLVDFLIPDNQWFLRSIATLVLYLIIREIGVTVLWGQVAEYLGTNFDELLVLEKLT